MRLQARSWRSASSALLPVATGGLAIAIFVADILTGVEVVLAVFYVTVVLIATRFCRPPGVVVVALGCVGLTVLSYFLSGESAVNTAISIAAIAAATFLALQSQSAEAALREQASLLDLTHDSIVARRFDDDVITYWSRGAEELYGWDRAEAVGRVGPELRQTTAPLPLDQIKDELLRVGRWEGELVNNKRDGTPVLVTSRWSLRRDRRGGPAIIVVTSNDITERRRSEQRVAAAYAVTRILAEADSLRVAAPDMLRAIGENLEWDWGALWSFDRERAQQGAPLRCESLWHGPDIETAEFATATRERGFASGEGRLGQVWASALPIWMVDATTDPEFVRAPAAAKSGLHGAVIFPILLDTEALGVVEFFSRAARERDEEQLATLSAIGSQIGQFIKRRRAEAALRASEERWRRLFETSAAGMALEELDGVFTAANPALRRMLGRTEEEIVGHNVLELNHEEERAATAEALAKFRSGSLTERQVEKKYLKKDNSLVWLNITTTLVPATETAAPFLQAVYMDITERVLAEAALRTSEERWRAIFDSAAVGIAAGDLRGGLFDVNPTFQRMLGYTEEELRNLRAFEFTHEDDRAETRRLFSRVVTGEQPSYRLEKRYRRKDGAIVWADVSASIVPATENTPAFLAVMAVDITDRKQAEEALREAEERFRTLVQFSFDVYWESDAQHRFIRQEFAEGLADAPAPSSEIGKTRWEVPYLEPDAEAWRKHRETLDAHLPFRDFEHARPTPDGGKRYVSVSGLPVFDKAGLFIGYRGVGRHITDRKRAEAALRASEERWRAMVETAPVGITMLDVEHRGYLAANKAFQRMTGYTEDELRQLTALDVTHEDDRGAAQKRIVDGVIGGQQKRYRRKDGGVIWADVAAFVVPATDSTPAFLGAVIVDITDRKHAEAALRASEERWRTMFEAAAVGVATTDLEHRYVTANETYQRMTGYTERELQNLTPEEITHGDDLAATQRFLDGIFTGLHRSYRIEKRYRRKDGEVVWADVNPFFVPATESTPALCAAIVVDITERKRAEEALQQAQADLARLNRAMLLGEMTASIAHEVNQPIAATLTNAHAGLRWLGAQPPDVEEVRQALGRIVRDGSRAGEVINRIRALVRKVPPRRDYSDVNEAIREVIALTQTDMQRNGVRLQTQLGGDLPLIRADRVQLQQVIMNLIVNAVEAMSSVGDRSRELTIASGKDDANAVFVEVRDTGPGIDPADLDHLFQSFYTTKPDGIGMGLAISRSIAEAHGGGLSAAPNDPRGAVFRLTLPVEETLSGIRELSRP